MTGISRRVRAAVFLRSFLIQGSWNYRTMIGGGFAFALLPALREHYGKDTPELDDAVERHSTLFNSHPYLVPLALGAVSTLEAEGAGAAGVRRFKEAVRGSLGTLGDRLVWAGWRPVCLLGTLALLLAGGPWWVGVTIFLLVYNAGQLALRVWGYRIGGRDPRRIGEHLRNPAFDRLNRFMGIAGTFLVGLLVPIMASGMRLHSAVDSPAPQTGALWLIAGVVGALIGAYFGRRTRDLVALAIVGVVVTVLVVGLIR